MIHLYEWIFYFIPNEDVLNWVVQRWSKELFTWFEAENRLEYGKQKDRTDDLSCMNESSYRVISNGASKNGEKGKKR